MSSLLGTLTVLLQVATVGTVKAIKEIRTIDRAAQATTSGIAASATSINASLMSIGRTLTQFVTLPLGIMQVVAVKSFSTFEYNLAKITGLVGIAAMQTQQWGKELLVVSKQVGKSTRELSEALYFITTGGIRGADTMQVLATSAKLSAAGMGDTKSVADILVSAMNAYGKANLSAAQAGDILVRSVREGKAEADQLVKSMGVVFPIASQLGVSFGEVGAGMAAMTRTGTTAATSAMQLRRILYGILKPAVGAEGALRAMGSSSLELQDSLRNNGLLETLMQLKDMMDTFGEQALAKAFPNIRALAGILDILGPNLEENKKLFDSIANSAGDLSMAFENVSETFRQRVNVAFSKGNVLMVKFGEAVASTLLPLFERLGEKFNALARWFDGLTKGQQKFVATITLLITVVGPLLALLSAFLSITRGIGVMLGITQSETMKNTLAVKAQTEAIKEQTAVQAANNAVNTEAVAIDKALISNATIKAKTLNNLANVTKASTMANVMSANSMNKMTKVQVDLNKAKNISNASTYRLIVAEKLYENNLKSGYIQKVLQNQAIKAEIAHKQALNNVTISAAKVTELEKIAKYKKMRADALAIAVAREEQIIKEANVIAQQKEAFATEQARLAKQRLIVSSAALNGSISTTSTLIAREITALELQNAVLYKANLAKSRFIASTRLMNGEYAVSSVLLYRQAAAIELQSLVMYKATAATNKLSASTIALNKAVAFIGVANALKAILALFALFAIGLHNMLKQTELQKYQKKVINDVADAVAAETSQVKAYMDIAKNEMLTREQRNNAIRELNKLAPAYFNNLSLETVKTKEAANAMDAYVRSVMAQTKVNQLYELLNENEKEYTKSVMDGTNKRASFMQQAEAYYRMFTRYLVLDGNLLFKEYRSINNRVEQIESRNAERNKKLYEQKKQFIFDELSNREQLVLALEAETLHLESMHNSLMGKEKAYQEALRITAEEKQKAIANIITSGKSQLEIEEEIAKVTLDIEKAVRRSGAAHKAEIYKSIELIDAQLAKLKEQKQYQEDRLENDIYLTRYLEQIKNAANKKELKEIEKLYDERKKFIEEDRKKLLESINGSIAKLEEFRVAQEGLYGEKVLTIKIDIDVQKAQNEYDEMMRQLGRGISIFNLSELDIAKAKFDALDTKLNAYKALSDEQMPLDNTDLKLTQQEWVLQKAIVESLEKKDEKLKKITKEYEKQLRLIVDVYNDFNKVTKTNQLKDSLFNPSFLDKLSTKTNTYKSVLDDLVDSYINNLIEQAKDGTGKLTKSINDILKNVKITDIIPKDSKEYKLLLDYSAYEGALIILRELDTVTLDFINNWQEQQNVLAENQNAFYSLIQTLQTGEGILLAWGLQMEQAKLGIGNVTVQAEQLDDVLKELDKHKSLLTPEFIERINLLKKGKGKMEINEIFTQMDKDIAEVNLKAQLLGSTFETNSERVRVLGNVLRAVTNTNFTDLGMTIEQWEEWRAKVQEVAEQHKMLQLEMQLVNSLAGAMADSVIAIASSLDDLESAWKKLGDIALSIIEQIIKSLLTQLFLQLLTTKAKEADVIATNNQTLADTSKLIVDKILNSTKKTDIALTGAQIVASKADTAATLVNTAAKGGEAAASAGSAVASSVSGAAKMPFPASLIAIPIALGVVMAALAMMSSAKKKAKMAHGGIVPQGYPNDSYPAMLSSGEMVVPPHKLPEFNRGPVEIKVVVEGVIRGSDIHYITREVERKYSNVY